MTVLKKACMFCLALLLLSALFALPVVAAEESAAEAASDPSVWQNGLFALFFRD